MPYFGGLSAFSFVKIPHRCLGAAVDTHFFKNILQMAMHSPDADAKRLGNFLVHKTFAQQIKYLVLSMSQLRHVLNGAAHWQGSN